VDVAEVLKTLLENQAEAIHRSGLSVRVAQSGTARLRVIADRAALDTALGNLLQNAIKYTPAGGRIEIRVQREPGQPRAGVRISVTDSGIGIRPEEQTRVFERFYRVDKGRARQVGGAGLGLSIVRSLVERMAGRLELTSQVAKGSTFSVVLPEAPSEPQP
jgi:signal transduction histidine kinase